ncbi:MAG TPA: phage tail tube protein [Gemmatimonadales bacterium]|nr:phage tail tube protein [Gemmatimonadales bacterium]
MGQPLQMEAVAVTTKVESTYNTDVTPATTDAVRLIMPRPQVKIGWGYDGDRGPQNAGNGRWLAAPPNGRTVSGSIKVEPKGLGASYASSANEVPDVHRFLRAAGFTATLAAGTSWTFTPDLFSVTPASLSTYFYEGGELWKACGMYTDLKIDIPNTGIPTFEFPFAATMVTDPADLTLPSMTYTAPTIVPPSAAGVGFTLHNLTGAVLRSASFSLGRSFSNPRLAVAGGGGVGHAGFATTFRKPVLDLVIEMTALTTTPFTTSTLIDPYSLEKAGTTGICSLQFGGTTNNKWKLTLNQCQVVPGSVEKLSENNEAFGLYKLQVKPYVTTDQGIDDITLLWN